MDYVLVYCDVCDDVSAYEHAPDWEKKHIERHSDHSGFAVSIDVPVNDDVKETFLRIGRRNKKQRDAA
jgi:hypothetical protein